MEREKTFAYNLLEKSMFVQLEICTKCGRNKINLVKIVDLKLQNYAFFVVIINPKITIH